MTTAEQMAVAVLKGDLDAARALATLLTEQYAAGGRELLPVKVIGEGTIKSITYYKHTPRDKELDEEARGMQRWLSDPNTQIIQCGPYIDRIELYEFPKEKP